MKKILMILSAIMLLSACNSDSSGGGGSSSDSELQLDQSVTGSIAEEGEVDIYHVRVNDANTILSVSVEGDTVHPEVDLLVTAYEDEVNENNRLLADHAQEDAYLPADVNMNIYIDQPKDVYITVRDLMDDEADPEQRYHLKVSTAGSTEENDDFGSATILIVNDTNSVIEKIDYIGDRDCYSFIINQEGVYSVTINFDPFVGGTSVKPAAELYGPDGELIDSTDSVTASGFVFLTHMAASAEPYHIVIEDSGNDDFDQSSIYSISVASKVSGEIFLNDVRSDAAAMPETAGQIYSVNASLDYAASTESELHAGDMDWYTVPVQDVSAAGIKVINITMTDIDSTMDLTYRLSLMEESGNVLFTHDYDGGSSLYRCQVKAGTGVHYVLVQAVDNERVESSEAYTLEVEVTGVQDAYEAGDGNNTESFATDITSGSSIEGRIAYRGDVDWYKISIPASAPRVLEVSLDSAVSMVDYDVQIRVNNNTVKRIYDTSGSDAPTQLETGIYIESSGAAVDYYIRVADYQGDDGDEVPYTLMVNIASVPEEAEVPLAPDDGFRYYFSEIEERAMDSTRSEDVELEIFTTEQPTFKTDTGYFDFRAADYAAKNITRINNGDGTVTITFPWIAGFVDYQGDRDFFQVDLNTLDPENPDEQWYYDVEIRLATKAATDVEYNWKFYRDHNGNNIIMDNPGADDGYKACDGDITLTTETINITTPSGTDTFYVGDRWTTETPRYYTVYIGVSDFNYVNLPTSNENDPMANPDPDDDWGYDAPYYFKVVLTYHPGVSYP